MIARIIWPKSPNKKLALVDSTGAPVSNKPKRSTLVAPMLAINTYTIPRRPTAIAPTSITVLVTTS